MLLGLSTQHGNDIKSMNGSVYIVISILSVWPTSAIIPYVLARSVPRILFVVQLVSSPPIFHATFEIHIAMLTRALYRKDFDFNVDVGVDRYTLQLGLV